MNRSESDIFQDRQQTKNLLLNMQGMLTNKKFACQRILLGKVMALPNTRNLISREDKWLRLKYHAGAPGKMINSMEKVWLKKKLV